MWFTILNKQLKQHSMALLTFHTIPHVKKFQSTLLSRASFFTCFCHLVCILAPIFIVYNSHGLWIKYQVHQEQPNVHFKHRALLLVRSKESSFSWSTFNEYNSLVGQYLNFPSILVSIHCPTLLWVWFTRFRHYILISTDIRKRWKQRWNNGWIGGGDGIRS